MWPESVGGRAAGDQLFEPGSHDDKILPAVCIVDEIEALVEFTRVLGSFRLDLNGAGEVNAVSRDGQVITAADDIFERADSIHAAAAAGDAAATAAAAAAVVGAGRAGGHAGNGAGRGIDAVGKAFDRDSQRAGEHAVLQRAGHLILSVPAGRRPLAVGLLARCVIGNLALPGLDIGLVVELPGEEEILRVGALGKGGLHGEGIGLRCSFLIGDVDPVESLHLLLDRGSADGARRTRVGTAAAAGDAATAAAGAAGAGAVAVGRRAGQLIDGDLRRIGIFRPGGTARRRVAVSGRQIEAAVDAEIHMPGIAAALTGLKPYEPGQTVVIQLQ